MLIVPLHLIDSRQSVPVVPPYCAALGRAVSWDSKGAYPLDYDTPLTSIAKKIVMNLSKAELGRAESLARWQLDKDSEDLVPAWALSQILRVRKQSLVEYHRSIEGRIGPGLSIPRLLFGLHVCRLAEAEMPPLRRRTGDPLRDQLRRDQDRIRDLLMPYASWRIGIAISLFETSPFWILTTRGALEKYRASHPHGPEMRPLLCQAYLWGLHLGPKETFLTPQANAPEEPQPERALAIARSLLKDRPDDCLGHYYAGVSQFYLRRTDLAVREMRLALTTKVLPPTYEALASRFVERPGFAALTRYKVVY